MSDEFITTAGRMGPLLCHVQDGRLIATKSALKGTFENSLASTGADQVYSQARIKTPMVRKGFLHNPTDPQGIRGQDDYVAVSWSEALALIDTQHKRIREQHGASAIYAGSYGWRSSASLHRAQTLLQRYMGLAGGYTTSSGDYSTGAAQVILPHVTGSNEVYDKQTSYPVILEHSDVVVLWSVNPLNCLKIAWSSADPDSLEFHNKLKASGKKIIAIDPMRSETIEFYGDNVEWIAPHPMTDVALMLGIAHSLVSNNLHDKAFLASHCQGYDIFERYLLGETDGVAKDAQWAADICGLSSQTITELAKVFSQNRTMIIAGWAMQRQEHGEQRHWMLATLAAMLGQIGLAGGGFGFSYRFDQGGQSYRLAGLTNPNKAVDSIPVTRLVEALERPQQSYQHNGQTRIFPQIEFIWWAGGANFTHHQDSNRLIRAWQKPQCVVVSEIYWTAAAKHADIILPITTSFERNDIIVSGAGYEQFLVPMKQVVAPQHQARNDYDVFAELSDMLFAGGKAAFTENKSELEWLAQFYQQSINDNPLQQNPLPSFDKFWQDNQIITLNQKTAQDNFIRFADFRQNPSQHPLKTPSGKIEIYSETIASFGLADCPAHPTWMMPTEHISNAQPGELQLLSAHSAHRLHSQFNYAKLREQYAIADREPISINSLDAEAHGIKTGDLVRVYNQRGQVLAGAKVTDGIKQGSVCIAQGAWLDLDPNTGICKNGNVNVLSPDMPSSRLANGCAANSALVRIEKYSATAPKLTAFTPPTSAQ